jgi:hypothetical protein
MDSNGQFVARDRAPRRGNCFGEPITPRRPIQSPHLVSALHEPSADGFLCELCASAVEFRSRRSLLTLNCEVLTPSFSDFSSPFVCALCVESFDLFSTHSEPPTNDLSSTFVLALIGPSGLSTPPLPIGILSRVRGSPKCLECLHLHHPNAHERPAPPPAAPPSRPEFLTTSHSLQSS